MIDFTKNLINGIYGQCVADAVGNPFEFKQHINPKDVVDYANSAKKLVISDDSQMMLFGFESLYNIIEYHSGDFEKDVSDTFTKSYIDWYETQTSLDKIKSTGLLSFDSMYSRQAPGNTCLSALSVLKSGKPVINASKGCGSVMRLLPLVTFLEYNSLEDSIKFAQITGNITHKHPENDVAIEYYIKTAHAILNNVDYSISVANSIDELGSGWTAYECVDMAVWAFNNATTFDELLSLSIVHDGDSDSVAAVAGSLWGLSGREVTKKYIDKLNALDAINFVIRKYVN